MTQIAESATNPCISVHAKKQTHVKQRIVFIELKASEAANKISENKPNAEVYIR